MIVSYFEWVQDLQFYFWSVEELRRQLNTKLSEGFEQVWEQAHKDKIDLRKAAFSLSVDRLSNVIQKRGFFLAIGG